MYKLVFVLIVTMWLSGCGSDIEISQGTKFKLDGSGLVTGSFSDDGQWLTIHDVENRVQVWSVADKKLIFEVPQDRIKQPVRAVLLSKDKNMLVVASDNLLSFWSVPKQKLVTNVPFAGVSPVASVSKLALSDDNRRILVAMNDGSLNMADLHTKLNNRFMPHSGPIRHVLFAPSGEQFLSASLDGKLALWSFGSPNALFEKKFDRRITSLAANKAFTKVFVSDNLYGQHIVDLSDGEALVKLDYMARFKAFREATFIPNSGLLATSSSKDKLSIWQYDQGVELGSWEIQRTNGNATIVTMYSPDRNTLFTLSSEGVLETWSIDKLRAHL